MKTKTLELIDGNMCDFGPVSVAEMEAISDLMRDHRVKQCWKTAPVAPIYADAVAKAVSLIECTPVGIPQVLFEWSGKVDFAFASAKRAGTKMSKQELAALLPIHDEFWWALIELNGFQKPTKVAEGSDPTSSAPNTSETYTEKSIGTT